MLGIVTCSTTQLQPFILIDGGEDSTSTIRDGRKYGRRGSTMVFRQPSHESWRVRPTAVDGRCCEDDDSSMSVRRIVSFFRIFVL